MSRIFMLSRKSMLLAIIAVIALILPLAPARGAPTEPVLASMMTTPSSAPLHPLATFRTDEPPPSFENVWSGVFGATEEELNLVAETACEMGKIDDRTCRMSADEVRELPSKLDELSNELEKLANADPEIRAWAQSRSAPDLTKALAKLTKLSTNPSMKNLTSRAGDFADLTGRVTTTAGALTANTAAEYAKAVVYLTASTLPVVGDLLGLAESIANGDVEGGVIAVFGLVGAAIGLAFPPAGAIIAAGIAIYNFGKFVWNYFRAKPRDWIDDPPATPKELFESGADMKWTAHKVGDKTANVVFDDNELIATQTLLLNSKWTKYNKDRKPVNYTIPADKSSSAHFFSSFMKLSDLFAGVAIVWQDGKAYTSDCKVVHYGAGYGVNLDCTNLDTPVTISLNHNAVLEVRYIYQDNKDKIRACPQRPCVLDDPIGFTSRLEVLSEGTRRVVVNLPFSVGIA